MIGYLSSDAPRAIPGVPGERRRGAGECRGIAGAGRAVVVLDHDSRGVGVCCGCEGVAHPGVSLGVDGNRQRDASGVRRFRIESAVNAPCMMKGGGESRLAVSILARGRLSCS
jgi:hypothetical protein